MESKNGFDPSFAPYASNVRPRVSTRDTAPLENMRLVEIISASFRDPQASSPKMVATVVVISAFAWFLLSNVAMRARCAARFSFCSSVPRHGCQPSGTQLRSTPQKRRRRRARKSASYAAPVLGSEDPPKRSARPTASLVVTATSAAAPAAVTANAARSRSLALEASDAIAVGTTNVATAASASTARRARIVVSEQLSLRRLSLGRGGSAGAICGSSSTKTQQALRVCTNCGARNASKASKPSNCR